MTFPSFVQTREASIGTASLLISADPLVIQVTITPSRGLVWDATGDRFESSTLVTEGNLGESITLDLPCTDVAGWRDSATGALIDVSAPDSYTHTYTAVVRFLDAGKHSTGRAVTLGPFVLPAGDGSPMDLDKLLPVPGVAGGSVLVPDSWSALVADAVAAAEAIGNADNLLTGTVADARLPVTAQAATLAATYTRPQGGRTALLGDSITDRNALFTIGGGYVTTPGAGYFWQANMHLRDALTLVHEGGVSGEKTDQMLIRVPDVLATTPDICVVLGGTNDVFANRTTAQVTAGLTAIYDALRAGGVLRIAAGHIPPADSYTSGQRLVASQVNAWITDYCRASKGMVCVPWAAVLTDPTTGNYLTGMATDGTHPSTSGAAFMGRVLAGALRPWIRQDGAALATSNTDPNNAITNGMMVGDTAGIADTYTVTNVGGTAVFAARKRARTDAPGYWQEIAMTSGAITLQADTGAAGTAWQVGDTVQGSLEIDTDSDLDALTKLQVFLQGSTAGGGIVNQSAGLYDSYTSPRRTPVHRGVITTQPLLVTATMAKLQLRLHIAGTGIVRTSRWMIRKVG